MNVLSFYQSSQMDVVEHYVALHAELHALLEESLIVLKQWFGSNANLHLEFLPQENSRGYGRLFLLVESCLQPIEAERTLKRLEESWWEKREQTVGDLITLDVKYSFSS